MRIAGGLPLPGAEATQYEQRDPLQHAELRIGNNINTFTASVCKLYSNENMKCSPLASRPFAARRF